jgi:adenine-specific DNA methylase
VPSDNRLEIDACGVVSASALGRDRNLMKVYRGDSIPKQVENVAREDRGRTFADHFCGTGLMAKFADGGSSKLLRGKDLIHMILSHVGC